MEQKNLAFPLLVSFLHTQGHTELPHTPTEISPLHVLGCHYHSSFVIIILPHTINLNIQILNNVYDILKSALQSRVRMGPMYK